MIEKKKGVSAVGDLNRLKELVFATDNKACFIERDRTLARLRAEFEGYEKPDRFARIFARLMAEMSTPIEEADFFAGRVVEALPDEGLRTPEPLLGSTGHQNPNYEKLLKLGLKGILEETMENAARLGDEESRIFADNAKIVVDAIRDFALRYAAAARKAGKEEMAKALETVPYEPAYDFYSALQSIWMYHMIASCYIGERDYGFGNFDQYLLPYYQKALADGKTKEELTRLLAGFFVKTNEICGRATHNYNKKPIRPQASKQYVNIGGKAPNAFSFVVLEAAKRVNMAQPQIVVLLDADKDPAFTQAAFEALAVLTDKMNLYNYPQTVKRLEEMGIPKEVAEDHCYSACCTFDLHWRTYRMESYIPVPQLFVQAIHEREYDSLEGLLQRFRELLVEELQTHADKHMAGFAPERARRTFLLDGLLLGDGEKRCRPICDNGSDYNVLNLFCPGIATIGDSLLVLDKLVFREKRFTYRQFADILLADYHENEGLRQEILNLTRFGNDSPADDYTVLAANTYLDAVGNLKLKPNVWAMGGFYSLEKDNLWAAQLGATPDGRKAGSPFSENQSPTYGADKRGITALLKSIAKLPLRETVTGGMNLTFYKNQTADIYRDLVLSFFQMGGLHVGITVADRKTLMDAMEHPEKYPTLTVRLYGFSEYFVSLPRWQQQAILDRTGYQ